MQVTTAAEAAYRKLSAAQSAASSASLAVAAAEKEVKLKQSQLAVVQARQRWLQVQFGAQQVGLKALTRPLGGCETFDQTPWTVVQGSNRLVLGAGQLLAVACHMV
jgi:hypothetical protein